MLILYVTYASLPNKISNSLNQHYVHTMLAIAEDYMDWVPIEFFKNVDIYHLLLHI